MVVSGGGGGGGGGGGVFSFIVSFVDIFWISGFFCSANPMCMVVWFRLEALAKIIKQISCFTIMRVCNITIAVVWFCG